MQQSPTCGRSVLSAEWMVCTKLAATLESISLQTEMCLNGWAAKLFDMCLDGCAAKRFDVIFCCSSLWGRQCRLLTFLLALTMIPLNALRPDVVPDASFTFMVRGPCIIADLRGNTGRPWSKGLFMAVSAEGQTAVVTAKFFGDGAAQNKMHSEFLSKFKPNSVWVVNEGKQKKCGFKGNPRNPKWSCASAPIDLELVASTVLTATTTVEIKRPTVGMSLADILSKDSEQKVEICAVVKEVGTVEMKQVKRDKSGSEQPHERPLCKLRVQDWQNTEADVALWGEDLCQQAKNLTNKVVAFYRMKMNIHSSGKSLASGDDTFLEVLTLESHVNKNERYMLENLQTIQQSAPTLSATTRATGEQTQMLGPLRVVCIRSLALAQELQQDLDESAWQFDAAIWCALARNQYFFFAFERLLMIQMRLFNVCLAFIPLLLPCDTCIEKYMSAT